jgi:predicted permease
MTADVWMTLAAIPDLATQDRGARNLQVMGRLADGVTGAQASTDLEGVLARLARDFPDTSAGMRPVVQTWSERFNGGPIRTVFLAMMGAVAFVLLIACANVANLLLARAAQRAPEIAVRVSMGATRWQLARQLLVESVLLAALGGVAGFALAAAGVRLFDRAVSSPELGKPYWVLFEMDWTVAVFLAVVCLGTGLLFGLAPALHVSRSNVGETLKEGGRSATGGARAQRWTSALLVAELALTIVLLAGAGLMVRSFLALYQVEVGIDTAPITTMRFVLPQQGYPTPEARTAFADRLEDRLGRLRAVPAASFASTPPVGGGGQRRMAIDGRPIEAAELLPTVTTVLAGERYFETIGVAVRGRTFTREDGTTGREVAIVNARLAALHFPDADAIGQRIQITNANAPPSEVVPPWVTIVGVSPTVRQGLGGDSDPLGDPVVYLPYRADPIPGMALLVRAPGAAGTAATLLREEVRALDPELPVFDVRTLDEQMALSRWPWRVFGSMFAIFAVVALVLSAVGLYAVTARSVTQRTAEIGVRMVLGAQPFEIQRMILRQGAVKLVVGLAIGLAGALGVGRILEALLVVGQRDLVTLATIVVVLCVVSVTASLLPARRAARLDPMTALRDE